MSKFIVEQERKTETAMSCEVLVAGGGIAGISAAIAAARNGKKVVLLEREFGLGGMATLGLITIYLPLCDGEGRQMIYGIGEELLKLSIEHGAEENYPKPWLEDGSLEERKRQRYFTQYNPHMFALKVEALLTSLGVTILYGTLACGVTVIDGFITHVIIENKSGRSAIEAETVVDCTGDADICHLAGADTVLHNKGNGLASWYYYTTEKEDKIKLSMFGLADVVKEQEPRDTKDSPYKASMTESLDKNHRFSGVNGFELSSAVIAAHSRMLEDILRHRKKDESYLPVTTASIPLVRMSRRIKGIYVMDDSEMNIHMKDSIGLTGDWRKCGPAYEIPFGTLYGNKIKNLITAGRDISVTDAMWDITRVIPPCAVTGQAAGTAAALGKDFSKLEISLLQKTLVKQNVKIHLD